MRNEKTSSKSTVSAANTLAALASFVIPGLGQLVQARLLSALIYFSIEVFILWVTLPAMLSVLGLIPGWASPWVFLIPLISHAAAAHDAATYNPS